MRDPASKRLPEGPGGRAAAHGGLGHLISISWRALAEAGILLGFALVSSWLVRR
ncbi:MAG: hypothetical protein LAQ30_20075 [Acidobacteriia bacterium]|nr:hypothetical protein [Terriglobia bacterium]